MSGDNARIEREPSDPNGNRKREPVEQSHSGVLMVFAILAGIAVLVSGVFVGFSAFQVILGSVGVVVGTWALLTHRHRPE